MAYYINQGSKIFHQSNASQGVAYPQGHFWYRKAELQPPFLFAPLVFNGQAGVFVHVPK